jgi:hypothetical protein
MPTEKVETAGPLIIARAYGSTGAAGWISDIGNMDVFTEDGTRVPDLWDAPGTVYGPDDWLFATSGRTSVARFRLPHGKPEPPPVAIKRHLTHLNQAVSTLTDYYHPFDRMFLVTIANSLSSTLHALDRTGRCRWERPVDTLLHVDATNGLVYIRDSSWRLAVLDARDGARRGTGGRDAMETRHEWGNGWVVVREAVLPETSPLSRARWRAYRVPEGRLLWQFSQALRYEDPLEPWLGGYSPDLTAAGDGLLYSATTFPRGRATISYAELFHARRRSPEHGGAGSVLNTSASDVQP